MIEGDDYILGNSVLHQRLCLITEILGKFVSSAPRALSVVQLGQHTGLPARELVKLCGGLWRAQLLRPHQGSPDSWELACAASEVTLEDVFRCAVAEQPGRLRAFKPAVFSGAADSVHRDVDLLLTQAAMAINQSVFQHLRQFSLDRLKVSVAGAARQRETAGVV